MHRRARRLPNVSPWAKPFVEPDGIDVEPDLTSRPSLMDRVRAQQSDYAEKSRHGRRSSWINGLSGWGCMFLSFVHWPIAHASAVLWIAAVLLWALAFTQWTEFIVNRNASRMMPDPDGLADF